jgi:hypothetical protein
MNRTFATMALSLAALAGYLYYSNSFSNSENVPSHPIDPLIIEEVEDIDDDTGIDIFEPPLDPDQLIL